MKKRLFKRNIYTVLDLLEQIFSHGMRADKAVPVRLKDRGLGSNDRRFIAETTYDITRFWYRYTQSSSEKEALQHYLLEKGYELPEWFWEAKIDGISQVKMPPDIYWSVPKKLYNFCETQLGEKWLEILPHLNEPKPVGVRLNNAVCLPADFEELLNRNQVEWEKDGVSNGYVLTGRKDITRWKEYKAGWFELQDVGSQRIGKEVQGRREELIIDLCAGAGGKTLQIADCNPHSRVIATDIHEWKLRNLRFRAERAGFKHIETHVIERENTLDVFSGKANWLLVDAPCSGTGVWGRFPDAKYHITPNEIDEHTNIQLEILSKNHHLLKNGGKLVYATCSVLPIENEQVIQAFLEENLSFKLEKQGYIDPSEKNDGFFVAVLQKD